MPKRQIAILLVEPENPDNIGAVARAMKNMGLDDLRLVNPPKDWKERGKKMAVSAGDVLENARTYASVEASVTDAGIVIGTTRRRRRFNPNRIPFEDALKRIQKTSQKKTAIVMFGKESKGLDNDSLNLCNWITGIPASPVYPSINLAQSVMIVAHRLFTDKDKDNTADLGMGGEMVSQKEIFEVLEVLRQSLERLGYDEKPDVLDRIIATFHGMIKRGHLLKREEQMLKGISRRIRERVPVSAPRNHKINKESA